MNNLPTNRAHAAKVRAAFRPYREQFLVLAATGYRKVDEQFGEVSNHEYWAKSPTEWVEMYRYEGGWEVVYHQVDPRTIPE